MNSKTAKVLRQYSSIRKLPYKVVKKVFNERGKGAQALLLITMKEEIKEIKLAGLTIGEKALKKDRSKGDFTQQ
jgi:hypothetical protein